MRERELWEQPVTYAAVGATNTPEMLRYPPAGFRTAERRVRIGVGPARWEYAWMTALSGGIQRLSGIGVTVIDTPDEITQPPYEPVGFDADGVPQTPATFAPRPEDTFAPDGSSLFVPGTTVTLEVPVGPFRKRMSVRVVYVIDEPTRKGFAYGTLPGHPISGEEAFILDQDEDGAVWLTIRTLARPATTGWRVLTPALAAFRSDYLRKYLAALSGPIG